ncbi:MAG: four helix bundle protein, partial [Deltaproteobacteria bacterium]|nr:four helix bundle protein [Deltaproteobacteria bacterium]
MKRAALSIPSNISEGYEKKTTQEYFKNHYKINSLSKI